MDKIQKNLNVSEHAANVVLPALRRHYGTYSTAVDVALKNLYSAIVAEATGIEEGLQAAQSNVEKLLATIEVAEYEYRYDPRQSFNSIPTWMHIRFERTTFRDAAYKILSDSIDCLYKERRGANYYIVCRTDDVLSLE